ncbi:MAG: prepilin-type N-terminal cleavage/methylation domain-containing protein [Planctomycetes bacterium]|nr:prepilin-type N-terminal cleavage/methylation domain-containing protein [Planctomycetota bacterium]
MRLPIFSVRSAGFTLMEVLVSMFISALIMTAILGSLESTQKAVDSIHNITETERAGPMLVQMFRRDLDRLAVYDAGEYTLLTGESKNLGGVDADRINMIVVGRSVIPHYDPVLDRRTHAPINEVGYWVRNRDGSADFLELYRREDFLVDDEYDRDGSFSMLNDRIISFNLQYYDEPDFDPVPEDQWDSTLEAQLPYCIEMFLELEIQPRKSAESRQILGANRARLEFGDLLVIPEPTRFLFRNRMHPVVPGIQMGSQVGVDEDVEGDSAESEIPGIGNLGQRDINASTGGGSVPR